MSETSEYPTVEADDDGVRCQDAPDHRWGIRWNEIVRVTAGRMEAVAEVDTTIALDFECGEYVELNSCFPGFWEAVQAVCRRLPGVAPDWRARIDQLGVEDPPLVLWSRGAPGEHR